MPAIFVFVMIFAIVAVLLFGARWLFTSGGESKDEYGRTVNTPNVRRVVTSIAGVSLIISLFLLIFASTTQVGTRNVGVVTKFGKPIATLHNGIHFKAPWNKVTDVDGTIQTDTHSGDTCITIRIGNGSAACIDAQVRWRIEQDKADDLFLSYKTKGDDVNTAVRDSLVEVQLKAALNEVYGQFDPLAAVKGTGANVSVDSLSIDVEKSMKDRVTGLGNGTPEVVILSAQTPFIHLDQPTQDKINAYQAEIANTRIAEQREKTTLAEGRSNKNLASSVSQDPNVLVSKCLDSLNAMIKDKQPIPIGFSCWPNGGGTTAVIPKEK